jgi:hypothetical protein
VPIAQNESAASSKKYRYSTVICIFPKVYAVSKAKLIVFSIDFVVKKKVADSFQASRQESLLSNHQKAKTHTNETRGECREQETALNIYLMLKKNKVLNCFQHKKTKHFS